MSQPMQLRNFGCNLQFEPDRYYEPLDEQQVLEIYMAKLSLQKQSTDNAPDTNKIQVIKGQSLRVSIMTVSQPGRYEIYGIDNHGPTQRGTCGIWSRSSELRMSACQQSSFCFVLLSHLVYF